MIKLLKMHKNSNKKVYGVYRIHVKLCQTYIPNIPYIHLAYYQLLKQKNKKYINIIIISNISDVYKVNKVYDAFNIPHIPLTVSFKNNNIMSLLIFVDFTDILNHQNSLLETVLIDSTSILNNNKELLW